MSDALIDVVIPVGPKDRALAPLSAASVRAHVANVRRIFVVAAEPIAIAGTEFISESAFPFSLADVAALVGVPERAGWYFQQLVKLHFQRAVPHALDHVLSVDADVVFFRDCCFLKGGRARLASGYEYHRPYFEHMARLHASFLREDRRSGVAHCILFSRSVIAELVRVIEEGRGGRPFWRLYLEAVDPREAAGSGASEFELYFHYVLRFHRDMALVWPFRWRNASDVRDRRLARCDYAAFHWYLRSDVEGIAERLAARPPARRDPLRDLRARLRDVWRWQRRRERAAIATPRREGAEGRP